MTQETGGDLNTLRANIAHAQTALDEYNRATHVHVLDGLHHAGRVIRAYHEYVAALEQEHP